MQNSEKVRMGITQVTVTVRNPADPEKSWDGLFLVDTGSIDSLVPGNRLREIGMEPQSKRRYELADGTEISMESRSGSWSSWVRLSAPR